MRLQIQLAKSSKETEQFYMALYIGTLYAKYFQVKLQATCTSRKYLNSMMSKI